MFKTIFIASFFVLAVYGGAVFTADECNKVATADVDTKCKLTPTTAGGSKACCLAKVTDAKMAIPKASDNAANADPVNDIKIIASGVSGSEVATQYFACFAPGGQFRFKTGANSADAANKEAFAKGEALCGADGKTKASADATTGFKFTYCDADNCAGTNADVTNSCAKLTGGAIDGSRKGVCLSEQPLECSCGTSTIPTDSCAGLASADVKTKCTSTSDGGSPAKKCCLATFDALPNTQNGKKVQTPTKGGKVDGAKYYACYKSSSGKIRFKTASDATQQNKEAWLDAALFCGPSVVGKAQTGVTFTHSVSSTVTGSGSAGAWGTAKTCVCGSSNIFAISFTLLAVFVSLWK